MNNFYYENYLMHHGIKGMKWGIRRTPAQLGHDTSKSTKKQAKTDKAAERKQAKAANRAEKQRRKKLRANRRLMSDADMKKEIDRLTSEKKLKDLIDDDISSGRKMVDKLLGSATGRIFTSMTVGALAYAGYSAVSGKGFDPYKAAEYMFPNPNRKK